MGVKFRQLLKITCMLGVMCFTSSILFAQNKTDSVVLSRVYNYQRNFAHHVEGFESNVYLKYGFFTEQRNAVLFLIPHMYSIAKDERAYVGESYCRMTFQNMNDYRLKRHVSVGNIAHYKRALPTVLELLTPNLYNESLYKRHILSPFHKANRRFYTFKTELIGEGLVVLTFRPKHRNTQLVSGRAYVDYETGHISLVEMAGEYDLIDFLLNIQMEEEGPKAVMPKHCELNARFDFMGNHIHSSFEAVYNCPITLPDTLESVRNMELMDSLRPVSLTETEMEVYLEHCKPKPKPVVPDTVTQNLEPKKKHCLLREVGDFCWDVIGDNLFGSIRAENSRASFRLSPIINPQYLSYSHRRGLSYKMKLRSQYNFSAHRYLTFNPQVGYNFKFKQFYYTTPLRMTYNPKRNGYAEIIFGNGNRITNSSVLETIKNDSTDYANDELDTFKDRHLEVNNNIEVFDWLEVNTSLSFHHRVAVNADRMRSLNLPVEYHTFSPILSLYITPWDNGPLFNIDYERGIKGVWDSNIGYERWEFDGVWKIPLRSLSLLNLRVGGGFYTRKETSYFVDFANFRDDNVPGGWEDDWTGQFQLLRSSWYNASDFYIRSNLSFESPLLFATWLPLVGRAIESERLYLSGLILDDTRPYFEVGYGLSNRYFSGGIFASFLSSEFQEIGAKITFELFRKW